MSNTHTDQSNQEVTAKAPTTEYYYIPLWKTLLLSMVPFYIYLWVARNWCVWQNRYPKPYATRFGRWFWRQRRTSCFMFTGAGLIKDFMSEPKRSLWKSVGLFALLYVSFGAFWFVLWYLVMHPESPHGIQILVIIPCIVHFVITPLWYMNLQRIINSHHRHASSQSTPIRHNFQRWNAWALIGLLLGGMYLYYNLAGMKYVVHTLGTSSHKIDQLLSQRINKQTPQIQNQQKLYLIAAIAQNNKMTAQKREAIIKVIMREHKK